MDIFPLNIFPQGSLSSSVITTVWIGIFVVCFFNLRFGWVLSGLVVPGYLVPLLLIKPWAAAAILAESFVTYFLVWLFSERLSRFCPWSNFFGRDRFFALVLCSIAVRLFFDDYLLPEFGAWVNHYWGINFDYRNQLHSFGLIIIALIANQFWKTGLARGLVPLSVTLGLTLLIVRYGLMELTNFSLGSISYLYEGLAASILASPKAYIILVCTAFLASRMNLAYGWDFNGILIPSLLALQWYEPVKIIATVIESSIILLIGSQLIRMPPFSNMTIEGARKLLLFFNVSFAYKIALAYFLLAWFPEIKITDFYGFGYLLSTLIAIKIHDKGIFARLLGATLVTSLASVMLAGIIGFGLTLLPFFSTSTEDAEKDLADKKALTEISAQSLKQRLKQAQLDFYQAKITKKFSKASTLELESFSQALKLLKAHLKQADPEKTRQARHYLQQAGYHLDVVEQRYFYLHEKNPERGFGVYVIDSRSNSGLGIEIPAPLDEKGVFNAGASLFSLLGARTLAIAGSSRRARLDLSTDVLQNRQTPFHRFHQIMARHNALQVRTYTGKTRRILAGKRLTEQDIQQQGLGNRLWINGKIPEGLDLAELEALLKSWEMDWNNPPFQSLQREDSRYGFAELMLGQKTARTLLFGSLLKRQYQIDYLEQEISLEGYLQDWILNRKQSIATRGSNAYRLPNQGELLFLDENVLTPLLDLVKRHQQNRNRWNLQLEEDLQTINSAAQVMGYRIIRYRHKASGQNYLILAERDDSPRFWGLYIFRLSAHENQVVQIPRPLYDINSFEYGTALFERLQARALLIATTHPHTNTDGSSDIGHPDNKVNLFNLVSQVLARPAERGKTLPQLLISCRAFAYNAEQGVIDSDVILAFDKGRVQPEALSILELRLLESLKEDDMSVRLVDGSKATTGYEVGRNSQAAYLKATTNNSFALLWVSPDARARYRQQNENLWQAAQFDALGIASIEEDLATHIQQQSLGNEQSPEEMKALLADYAAGQNIMQLQIVTDYAQDKGLRLKRLLDISSRQSFLLISDRNDRLMAVANLFPRNRYTLHFDKKSLPEGFSEFVTRRSFWLIAGEK